MDITKNEMRIPAEEQDQDDNEDEEVKERNLQSEKQRMMDQWIMRIFIIPYRCVLNISALSNLTVTYRILLYLAVSNCSAERSMSRLKLVKNRLRNRMGDAWLSSLLILSSENNILNQIENEKIINKIFTTSVQRKILFLYKLRYAYWALGGGGGGVPLNIGRDFNACNKKAATGVILKKLKQWNFRFAVCKRFIITRGSTPTADIFVQGERECRYGNQKKDLSVRYRNAGVINTPLVKIGISGTLKST
ncbi:hypothetical protein PR048_030472 [Dryococelus australis]|uniref:HAT C-terminal dimerisation domain-containing protein n=1 Tax=Dryococelus australis TaxID=614101 RepID=A0ABQ9GBN5_9NEOP|nr:hypothetical protein PR048_030472 [Dryococelus australis]